MRKKKFTKQNLNQHLGKVPGTLVYTGEKIKNDFTIDVFKYNEHQIDEKTFDKTTEIPNFLDNDSIAWININGLNHINQIQAIGNHLRLHPLLQEDIVNVKQRPKIEEYEDSIFLTLKMLAINKRKKTTIEQVSIFATQNNLITFQEAEGDVFDALRERLRKKRGRVRQLGSDYLLYAILDAVIDYYFEIIYTIEHKIEALENSLIKGNPNKKNIETEIQQLNRELLKVRRAILPLKEVIYRLIKNDSNFISKTCLDYFQDLHDHLIQVIENSDNCRDILWSLRDMHSSILNNKSNEVMKVLTMVSTIFIPLSFIAGVYGMNFKNMPELNTSSGYFIVITIMLLIAGGMAYFFKEKKWF